MRLSKKNSFYNYIMMQSMVAFIIVAAFTVLDISLLSNFYVKSDLKSKITNSSRIFAEKIHLYNDNYYIFNRDDMDEESEIQKIVMDVNGNILLGEYPEKLIIDQEIDDSKIRRIDAIKDDYYMIDVRAKIEKMGSGHDEIPVIIRNFVSTATVKKHYSFIYINFYIFFIMLFLVSSLFIWSRIKRAARAITSFCEDINRICSSKDMSKRIIVEENDFDELKLLANANNSLLDLADDLVRTQKQFSSDVAHEIRTPIAVINAECQYAGKHLTDDKDIKRALNVIEEQANKTNQVVRQILKLTRLEKGQINIDFEYQDIREIIYSVCESEPLLQEKMIKVNYDMEEAYMKLDVSLMTIAIGNIISNAAKYSRNNSFINISIKKMDDTIRFVCRDFGIGIPKEQIESIFDRFYRTDSSRSTEGVGLGLPIAQRIMELHNAKIEVESIENEGTAFIVILPA